MKIRVDATAPAGSRVRAADRVLEHAQRALELEDIQVGPMTTVLMMHIDIANKEQ